MKNPNSTTVFPPLEGGGAELSITPPGQIINFHEHSHKAPNGMTPAQFVFWMHGVLFAARNGFTKEQVDCIRAALEGVKHV